MADRIIRVVSGRTIVIEGAGLLAPLIATATNAADEAAASAAAGADSASAAAASAAISEDAAKLEVARYFQPATGNLFNKDTPLLGSRPWFAGALTVDADGFYTDWFTCSPSTVYRARMPGGNAGTVGIHTRDVNGTVLQSEIAVATITTHASAVEMRIGGTKTVGSTDNFEELMFFESATRAPDAYIPGNLYTLNPDRVTEERMDGMFAAAAGDSQVEADHSFAQTLFGELGFDNDPYDDNGVYATGDTANYHKNYGIAGSGLTGNVNLTQNQASTLTPFCRRFQFLDATRAEFWWGTFINDFAAAYTGPGGAIPQLQIQLELGDFNQQIDLYLSDPITSVTGGIVTGGTAVDDETVCGAAIKLVMGMEIMVPDKPKFYVGPGSVSYQWGRITTVGADARTLNVPEWAEYLEELFGKLGARFYNPWSHGSGLSYPVPANRAINFADTVHFSQAGHERFARELLEWRRRQYV